MVPLATPMGGDGLKLAEVGTVDKVHTASHDLLFKIKIWPPKVATTKIFMQLTPK